MGKAAAAIHQTPRSILLRRQRTYPDFEYGLRVGQRWPTKRNNSSTSIVTGSPPFGTQNSVPKKLNILIAQRAVDSALLSRFPQNLLGSPASSTKAIW